MFIANSWKKRPKTLKVIMDTEHAKWARSQKLGSLKKTVVVFKKVPV